VGARRGRRRGRRDGCGEGGGGLILRGFWGIVRVCARRERTGEGKEDVPVKCACEDEIIVYTQFIQSLCEITLVD
jgi:hypothetical protein